MLIFDLKAIGNKLYDARTRKLLSRAEVAERAELSDRAYADIERGNVNMRLETFLKICHALSITPNDVLTAEQPAGFSETILAGKIANCTESEKQTALKLLDVYVDSVR